MRRIIGVAAILTLVLVPQASGQSAADTVAIKQAALDYIEGWYEGSAERMERALHPDLAKRTVVNNPQTQRSMIRHLTKSMMVEITRSGGGSSAPEKKDKCSVYVLDIFNNVASVKAVSPDFVDYLHIVRWNEGWKIVNVLWDPNIREVSLSAEERARYVGTYDLGQMQVRIYEEGESLMAQATGQPATKLDYMGDHVFVVSADTNIRLTFEVEGDRAVAFVLQQAGQTVRAPRVP
ncbi:MAG: hypothetical protein GTN62_09860 [Gemmatimonadales bacterium]|nr:hypothetical protein [Gemmatimonadales bacterium]NIN11850.1 hypothetical protein [Gemmatimonadales bacterium]NIN50400.1 hypothetical protein [Gemmatimonadales bacterium]NIP07864.1 hypothetical protein [Gemmatimonadales bacterium]NIR02069.1 hypothetical protein [Gemmatimonadales bacterium]